MKTILMSVILFFSNSSQSAIEDIFRGQTSIDKPFDLRDPFRPPEFPGQAKKNRNEQNNGVWNNQKKLEDDVKIEDIIVTGVLIGTNRRVILRIGSDPTSYTLKEGETVGPIGPEIKAILPGGIILAEKINNIYGEPEYIETVIPISN